MLKESKKQHWTIINPINPNLYYVEKPTGVKGKGKANIECLNNVLGLHKLQEQPHCLFFFIYMRDEHNESNRFSIILIRAVERITGPKSPIGVQRPQCVIKPFSDPTCFV